MKYRVRMPQDWFDSGTERQDLRRKSIRGSAWSVIGRLLNQGVRLVSLVALARMLSPSDFGVVGMVLAVVGIAGIFQDLGFSGATIRSRSLTQGQVSNLFWLNLAAGAVATLAVTAAAGLLQDFYSDQRIGPATLALAWTFVLNGAATQHLALLARHMRFGVLALINFAGALASAVVAIAGAWAGFGHWALIGGVLVASMLTPMLAWSLCDWRPGRIDRGADMKALMGFGADLAMFSGLGYVARNLHNLVIGRYWGAAEVGLYGRAAAIHQLMMGNVVMPAGQVAQSAMSRLHGEPERFREFYYRGCALVTMVTLPITFVGAMLATDLVHVLLGPQWLASAALFSVLSWAALPQAVSHSTGWVFLATGRTRTMLWWGVVGWSVIILATIVGARAGLQGIAAATLISALVLLVPSLRVAFSGTNLTVRGLAGAIAPSLAAGAIATSGTAALQHVWLLEQPLLRLIVYGGAFAALYLVLLVTVCGQRALIAEVLQQLHPALARVLQR